MRVGHELAANSERGVRFLPSFFFREIADARRGGRAFVRRSLAHIALGSDTTGIRIRVLSRNSGRVWLDRFSTSSSISRNWSNRSPDEATRSGNIANPIHRFLSFLDGIQEISKHVLFSAIFPFLSLSRNQINNSYKTISSFRYLNICSRTTFRFCF